MKPLVASFRVLPFPLFLRTGILSCLLICLNSCGNRTDENQSVSIEDIAANEDVAAYMNNFEGRGDQADDSQPIPPEEVLQHFEFPDDLKLELLAAEPLVNQPVELNFDHRGRMWVVQYGQYPFPAGVKIVGYDYHLRAQFDKIPDPPPNGVKGADSITLLEDTDGDGLYDTSTPVITGLNIATSVTWGRGQVWVLNPPYLIAYPDPDGDGIPDGKPKVHIRGFGLEDTHAVANSLRWGPDGWLYGAQGSTTTATINTSATKNLHFKGQGIWRYHPETEVFELYAEGGGNTFHVEIDDKGRIYSGTNAAWSRGPYYKQGAYYAKNWGKHGALTNPYALGYFPFMDLEGEKLRFTHAFIRYGGGTLPDRYHDALIGTNSLHNFVQVSSFEAEASTFRNVDTERVLTSDDHWFRPVDIKAGPDGGVYLADWYDSRLSHVDPRDTWHRGSGRIYRLGAKDAPAVPADFDLSTYSTAQLIELLGHSNRWFRQQALRQFGDRKDARAILQLQALLDKSNGQLALEALWALNLSGGFTESTSLSALQHQDPFVRTWAIRLIGDKRTASNSQGKGLAALARTETHPEVRSQLAASAKRLPGKIALSILRAMLSSYQDAEDPEIPLQIWWALEDKAKTDRQAVVSLMTDKRLAQHPILLQTLASRIMQRYIMEGGTENDQTANALLQQAPNDQIRDAFLRGLQEGLRGRNLSDLPTPLQAAIQQYAQQSGEGAWELRLRQGDTASIAEALGLIADAQQNLAERQTCIRLLGELRIPEALPVLLELVGNRDESGVIRIGILQSLGSFDSQEISEKVIAIYPDDLRADPDLRVEALSLLISREAWALQLLQDMDIRKLILPTDIPQHLLLQLEQYADSEIRKLVRSLWPERQQADQQVVAQEIDRVRQIIKDAPGDMAKGKSVFQAICGTCHILKEQGGNIGPDLTGYERSNLNYLLVHTINPHAEIREGYVNYRILTNDGRALYGILQERHGTVLTFQTVSGTAFQLAESEIEEMQAQSTSLMPQGLLRTLSDQQLQDLFSYLMH